MKRNTVVVFVENIKNLNSNIESILNIKEMEINDKVLQIKIIAHRGTLKLSIIILHLFLSFKFAYNSFILEEVNSEFVSKHTFILLLLLKYSLEHIEIKWRYVNSLREIHFYLFKN